MGAVPLSAKFRIPRRWAVLCIEVVKSNAFVQCGTYIGLRIRVRPSRCCHRRNLVWVDTVLEGFHQRIANVFLSFARFKLWITRWRGGDLDLVRRVFWAVSKNRKGGRCRYISTPRDQEAGDARNGSVYGLAWRWPCPVPEGYSLVGARFLFGPKGLNHGPEQVRYAAFVGQTLFTRVAIIRTCAVCTAPLVGGPIFCDLCCVPRGHHTPSIVLYAVCPAGAYACPLPSSVRARGRGAQILRGGRL